MTRTVKVSAHNVASYQRSAPRRKSLIANTVHRAIGAYDLWSERVCECAAQEACEELLWQATAGLVL